MWPRIAIGAVAGAFLALAVSIGFASTTTNPYPVGRAVLYSSNGSTVSGEAIIRRQLTAGSTHVMVRLAGLTSTNPPQWKIESGSYCGTASTATLLTQSATAPVTTLNTSMTAETYTATLAVSSSSIAMMTLRVYAGGAEVACGQIFNQPSQTGSQHWW
jgi:hypothetical protein